MRSLAKDVSPGPKGTDRPTTKEERKVNSNLKYFTSQITNELPGPQIPTSNSTVYALTRLQDSTIEENKKLE